jgi:hypothetical protein
MGFQQDATEWRRRRGRTIFTAGHQRVVQSGYAFTAGNYCAVSRRIGRCASCNSRGNSREGNRRQGNVCDVFAGARFGPVAPRAEESLFGIISRGGLDIDRLAVHNGGSRPQRLLGRRSDSLRCRNATEIFAAGFARGRIGALVGPRIVSSSPRIVLSRNQRFLIIRDINSFAQYSTCMFRFRV